jgi:SAM-dependent methyltransferase
LNEGDFRNVYEDGRRADSYDKLEFPGTYYIAFRDIPGIVGRHVSGRSALDFGCGTGRSTRFLKSLGFEAVGVDISRQMIKRALRRDPRGDYRLVGGSLTGNEHLGFDLIFSAFTFDNIPTMEKKTSLLGSLGRLLNDGGRIVNIVSSPEIYVNEWASFSTRDFPENRDARSGDKVRIVMLDVEDRRPVEDIVWFHDDYLEAYRRSGLETLEIHRPLAEGSEPYEWISETSIAPWTVYVLGRDI